MSAKLPYKVVRDAVHRYVVYERKKVLHCLGFVYDVPPHMREARGRWEAKRAGEVIGSANLLREAAELLWRTA